MSGIFPNGILEHLPTSVCHLHFNCCDSATVSEKSMCTEKSGYLGFNNIVAADQGIGDSRLMRGIGIVGR